MSASSPKVAVVIPNWNGETWLPGCLRGLFAQDFRDFEVVLVDNGSSDNSLSFVRQSYPQVQIVSFRENRGFAVAVNAGIRAGRSEYVALLNTDTFPRPGWLSSLVETMDSSPPEVVGLASKMLNMSNPAIVDDAGDLFSWYGAARKRGHGRPASEFVQVAEIFSPCAGAALYRRSFLEELGGFDERFFAYLEDVELGLRGRLRGYRCLYVPTAEVLHQGHGSGTPHGRYVRLMTRNRLLLLAKNIPLGLLFRHAWQLVYGQFYFLVAYKKPLHSLAGYVSFLPLIPHVFRERRATMRGMKISASDLDQMLQNELGEPPLRNLIKSWRRRFERLTCFTTSPRPL
jgi:GT2 family glycosyltransferase